MSDKNKKMSAEKSISEEKLIRAETVEEISKALGESKWMRKKRLESLERFKSSDASFGRYSRLLMDWKSLDITAASFEKPFLSIDSLVPVLPSDKEGSRATLLSHAVKNDETILTEILSPSDTWENLVMAGWKEGIYLKWKSGEASSEGVSYLSLGEDKGLTCEPVAINVGRGASADLFIHWKGSSQAKALHMSFLAGKISSEAKLRIFLLQEGEGSRHYLSSRFNLGRESSVDLFSASTEGKWRVSRLKSSQTRPGSSWKESHMTITSGREHCDIDSLAGQSARFTNSDVRIAAAVMNKSRTVFTGNILMEKTATQSEAELADHVLLLDPGARADSIPGLEILAKDVKAAHAAAIGRVDDEQLFYLQSRGLSHEEARKLLISGFLGSLFDRAPFEFIPEVLNPIIESKVK